MELQYFGANALKITTKKSTTIIDPTSDIAQLTVDTKKADLILATQPSLRSGEVAEGVFVVDGPGEYEFSDSSVKGVAVQPHTGSAGDMSATMYRLMIGDTTILVVGHVDEKNAETRLEEVGVVDVMIVPVGGGGYTLDAVAAANLIRAVEPKLVIPVHYNDGLKYELSQQDLEAFTKELGAPIAEDQPEKYKLKSLPEQLTVQVLKRQ